MEPHCAPCKMGVMQPHLAELRDRQKLRLEDIAETLEVAISTVSRWEAGETNIPTKRLEEIAAAYRCDVPEIFGARAAADKFPSEEAMTEILAQVQAQMPAMLPAAEWPRYVAEALKLRLDTLSNDRSNADRPDRQA